MERKLRTAIKKFFYVKEKDKFKIDMLTFLIPILILIITGEAYEVWKKPLFQHIITFLYLMMLYTAFMFFLDIIIKKKKD